MLDTITRIDVLGACFDSLVRLDLFNPHDGNKIKTIKGTLVYGKNGTGKSTIAKAFRKLAGEPVSAIQDATVYTEAGQSISLTEDDKKRIFVFDEDYVNKNVKLQQDHLETIVMLGQAADLTEKILVATAARDVAKNDYEQQNDVYRQYCDANNINSPKYYINSLIQALRGDDNWAGRDRKINSERRQNTSVREDTYKKFVALTPSKPRTELIIDYQAELKKLEIAKTGSSVIETPVATIPVEYTAYADTNVQSLLAEQIEKPILSERERRLIVLIQQGKAQELSQRASTFRKEETTECPYCFQPISSEYKKSLVSSVEKVLSKAVDNHRAELQKYILNPLALRLELYTDISEYQICMDLITEINKAIQACNDDLNKKINNPYEPIKTASISIGKLARQLNKSLQALEDAREKHNKLATKTEPIITELNRINGEIAHYDVAELALRLDKQQQEASASEKMHTKLKAIYEEKIKIVEDLEAQRSNIRLALDAINACMKYIFFSEDRLRIINSGGVYKLLSHGKIVKPCEVSVGERNIIGLSYFFTSIFNGQEEQTAYNKEYLLVIDDPVSSFDMENRIGILSFMKYKLDMFLEGNVGTRALVMTHDLATFYDVDKVFDEIMGACKQIVYPHGPKYNRFEVSGGCLKQFSYNGRQEYTETVKAIYAFALGENSDHALAIGNMMRQALEAFSTFVYKKGIAEVSTDSQILNLLNKREYVSYYRNLMYRLVLHGGSHKEDQVKTMNDFQFFSLISESEKRRTAKDVLCFIYLLNKEHLLLHLEGCSNVETNLESWCNNIIANAALI